MENLSTFTVCKLNSMNRRLDTPVFCGTLEAAVKVAEDLGAPRRGLASRCRPWLPATAVVGASDVAHCQHGVPCNTWILVRRETGEAVAETDNEALLARVNPERLEVLRPCQYLPRLNTRVPLVPSVVPA